MQSIPEGGVVIRRKHLFIAGAVAALIAATVLITLLVTHRSSGDAEDKTAETQDVIKLVGKHFELPTTEQPTVAQIKDMSKLAKQQFFVRAHNGDYLLVYNNERLAIIYRKSVDKLINVGPVDMNSTGSLQEMNDIPAQSVQ